MGFMDKIKGMVNPEDNYDDYDEYDDAEDVAYDDAYSAQPASPAHQTYGGAGRAALELKVVRPEKFDSVTQIADHLLNKRTVVLNLEATNKETARRMIDFLSGVAYSIEGSLKKVANTIYVITPNEVDISNEQVAAAAGGAEGDGGYTAL